MEEVFAKIPKFRKRKNNFELDEGGGRGQPKKKKMKSLVGGGTLKGGCPECGEDNEWVGKEIKECGGVLQVRSASAERGPEERSGVWEKNCI